MTRLGIAILAFVWAAAGTPAASAHAFLDHAVPAVGGSLAVPPAEIDLWFTQELEPAFSAVEVKDGAGARVDQGDGKVDPVDRSRLHATLKPLPPGTYTVDWHVVSVDTHRTEGEFTFTVGG